MTTKVESPILPLGFKGAQQKIQTLGGGSWLKEHHRNQDRSEVSLGLLAWY